MKKILKYGLCAALLCSCANTLAANAGTVKFQGQSLVTQQDVDAKIKELGLQSAPRDQVFMHILLQIAEDRLLAKKIATSKLESDADFQKAAKRNANEFRKSYYIEKESRSRITQPMRQSLYDQMKAASKGRKVVNPNIIVVQDAKKADELYAQVSKDKSKFATLATTHSIDPSKENGGKIGRFLPEDTFAPEVVKMLPSLKEGIPSKPIKSSTPQGEVYIIMMIDKGMRKDYEMPPITDPQVSQQIDQILTREMMKGVQADLLKELEIYDLAGKKIPLGGNKNQGGIPLIGGGVKK